MNYQQLPLTSETVQTCAAQFDVLDNSQPQEQLNIQLHTINPVSHPRCYNSNRQ